MNTEQLQARVEARNAAIDAGLVQLTNQRQAHLNEAQKLQAVIDELSAEKTENMKALGAE